MIFIIFWSIKEWFHFWHVLLSIYIHILSQCNHLGIKNVKNVKLSVCPSVCLTMRTNREWTCNRSEDQITIHTCLHTQMFLPVNISREQSQAPLRALRGSVAVRWWYFMVLSPEKCVGIESGDIIMLYYTSGTCRVSCQQSGPRYLHLLWSYSRWG